MASEQAAVIKTRLREFAASIDPKASLEELRAIYDGFAALTAEPTGIIWTEVVAGGVPSIWADAGGGATDRVLQYVHGGGYMIGAAKYYRNLTGHLAKALGCRVLNVDYRLAPEQPHPAAVDDSTAAYKWLLDQGIDPKHIAIAGDSAGGGLTMATLLNIKKQGLPMPAAAMPISPWIDMECTGESMSTRATVDLLVSSGMLKMMSEAFLQGQDSKDPLAAPLHGDLRGLCPLYIQVGDEETLLDDSTRLAELASAAGVETRIDVFPEMQHVFQIAAGNMPEADDAIQRMADWVRPRLGLSIRSRSPLDATGERRVPMTTVG
jgi:monoterpene epsilon-lactone hydrolase